MQTFHPSRARPCYFAAAFALAVEGCRAPIVDGEFASVVVYGQVTEPGGAPVPSGVVTVDALTEPCEQKLFPTLAPDTTDAAGRSPVEMRSQAGDSVEVDLQLQPGA